MRPEIRRALTPPPPDQIMSSARFAEATGITLRQLQWWDQNDYFRPEFGTRGHQRCYSVAQVPKARCLAKLRAARIPLSIAVRLLDTEGWSNVEVLTAYKIINGVLYVPLSKAVKARPCSECRRATRKPILGAAAQLAADLEERRLDAIAMRDSVIAERRASL